MRTSIPTISVRLTQLPACAAPVVSGCDDNLPTNVPFGTFHTPLYHLSPFEPTDAQFLNPTPWYFYATNLGPVRIERYPTARTKIGPKTMSRELIDARLLD